MGQIVFQATLGGQVALAGPNTASSFTLTLPAATDTLVGKATTDTLTNKTLTSPTITGATLTTSAFNGTVGATTPSTGAFTTLSTSSTTTFSGLTASTALALDASKNVVSVTNTGTGNNVLSASPTLTGTIAGASLSLSSLTSGRVTYAGASGLLSDSANLVWDNTNVRLGIGTTSPTIILHTKTAGGEGLRIQGTATAAFMRFTDASDVSTAFIGQNTVFDINNQANTAMRFSTNNSERMRIDSSGNVGIGTSSPSSSLDVSTSGTTVITLGTGNSYGLLMYKNGGTEKWRVGLSGNNNYTLRYADTSDVLIADTSGNLGLGVTPSATAGQLQVNGAISSATARFAGNANAMTVVNQSGLTIYTNLSGGFVDTTLVAGNTANTYLAFGIHNGTSYSERMRITSAGNVGVGLTPTNKFQVAVDATYTANISQNSGNGARIVGTDYANTAYLPMCVDGSYVGFQISGVEKGRFDSSGNFLVGQTSISTTTAGIALQKSQGANIWAMNIAGAASTSSNYAHYVYSTTASAYRFLVDYAGTISATSIVITAISDERLKENIKDIDTGLNSIMALKPRRFDWKKGKGQDKKNAAGFIAQEFETVFPECVGLSRAGGDGIQYKDINHETLIPTLVKAIQEQQALIESLTTRLNALENK
jgi:hypothetical protein